MRKDFNLIDYRVGSLIVIKYRGKINNQNMWLVRCDCGYEFTKASKFLTAKKSHIIACKYCGYKRISKKLRKDRTGQLFGNGCRVIEKSDKRNNHGQILWKCQCRCNKYYFWATCHIDKIQMCRKCSDAYCVGPKNSQWNPDLTDEERKHNRRQNLRPLIKTAYKRDNHTCQLCGYNGWHGKKLIAHHLDGFNWAKHKREDISNFITLCEDCHSLFHKLYGSGNNTSAQFSDFFHKIIIGKLEV